MGSDCSCASCSDPEASSKNTNQRKRGKGVNLIGMAPSEFEEVVSESEEDSVSAILDAPDNGGYGATPGFDGSTPGATLFQSTDDVRGAFKTAVRNGDEDTVMHLDQQYPDLNLLNVLFDGGDTTMHIAIKNKSRKLLIYCLENGLKVHSTTFCMHFSIELIQCIM